MLTVAGFASFTLFNGLMSGKYDNNLIPAFFNTSVKKRTVRDTGGLAYLSHPSWIAVPASPARPAVAAAGPDRAPSVGWTAGAHPAENTALMAHH